jgi:rhodanese-related sulfurtransferase
MSHLNNKSIHTFVVLAMLILLIPHCEAAPEPLDKDKITTLGLYLSAQEAYEMKRKDQSKVLFIDVRTQAELAFLGVADSVDANIPYMLAGDWDEWDEHKHNFKLFPNSNFLPYFNDYISEHGYNKDSTIILICRSGNRSSRAANLLSQVKYTKVFSVVDGYEGNKSDQTGKDYAHRVIDGWKNRGLPWSYELDEQKMYVEF